MVSSDARQVALGFLGPGVGVIRIGPGRLVAQVASAHDLERLSPIEVHAGRGALVEPRAHGLVAVDPAACRRPVEHRHGERHVDATERIDDVGELVEVEGDRMLNGNAEVLFDRRDELAETLVEAGVDLVRSGAAGIGDEEIAGDGEERQAMVCRIGVQDHHDVAVHPVDTLGAQAVRGVLDRERTARGGPDHQDVLGSRLLP